MKPYPTPYPNKPYYLLLIIFNLFVMFNPVFLHWLFFVLGFFSEFWVMFWGVKIDVRVLWEATLSKSKFLCAFIVGRSLGGWRARGGRSPSIAQWRPPHQEDSGQAAGDSWRLGLLRPSAASSEEAKKTGGTPGNAGQSCSPPEPAAGK